MEIQSEGLSSFSMLVSSTWDGTLLILQRCSNWLTPNAMECWMSKSLISSMVKEQRIHKNQALLIQEWVEYPQCTETVPSTQVLQSTAANRALSVATPSSLFQSRTSWTTLIFYRRKNKDSRIANISRLHQTTSFLITTHTMIKWAHLSATSTWQISLQSGDNKIRRTTSIQGWTQGRRFLRTSLTTTRMWSEARWANSKWNTLRSNKRLRSWSKRDSISSEAGALSWKQLTPLSMIRQVQSKVSGV